jgi:cell filamentation protein
MTDKYGVDGDIIYCYPNNHILRNKFNLLDEQILEEAEREFSTQAVIGIEYQEPPYHLSYLCNIHQTLFEDIYDWAGQLRRVDISKGSTRFCTFGRIVVESDKLFKKLAAQHYFSQLEYPQLIEALADFYCELNVIHPFREGNGRAQRILFEHLIVHCGYGVDWSQVKKEEWIDANIAGFHGNLFALIEVFKRCIVLAKA